MNDGKGKWSHLAHGTTVLLYSRGVQRYKGAFDHAMLESQLSVTVCAIYSIHIFTRCAQNPLTSTSFGIVCSIFAVQKALFPALPGMASSHTAKPSLAISKLTVTNLGLTLSTPCYPSRLAKLDHTLFDDTRGSGRSNTNGRTITFTNAQSIHNVR